MMKEYQLLPEQEGRYQHSKALDRRRILASNSEDLPSEAKSIEFAVTQV